MSKKTEGEIKAFSIVIEPMYVGDKKDKRLETVVIAKIYDPEKGTFMEANGIVPPRSRLGQEVKKLIDLGKQIKLKNK